MMCALALSFLVFNDFFGCRRIRNRNCNNSSFIHPCAKQDFLIPGISRVGFLLAAGHAYSGIIEFNDMEGRPLLVGFIGDLLTANTVSDDDQMSGKIVVRFDRTRTGQSSWRG